MITLPHGFACKTCLFWRKPPEKFMDVYSDNDTGQSDNSYAARLRVGLCKKATMMDNATDYKRVADVVAPERVVSPLPDDDTSDLEGAAADTVLIEKNETLKMYVQDASSYRAELFTKAEFFCAHHEFDPDIAVS